MIVVTAYEVLINCDLFAKRVIFDQHQTIDVIASGEWTKCGNHVSPCRAGSIANNANEQITLQCLLRSSYLTERSSSTRPQMDNQIAVSRCQNHLLGIRKICIEKKM